MKRNNNANSIADEYLKSLEGLSPAKPKDFFYDRLVNRLTEEKENQPWLFPLKPVWMIWTLAILLIVNLVILTTKKVQKGSADSGSIESFAAAYDQNISSY